MGDECRGQKGLVKQGMFFLMAVQKFSRNWHISFFSGTCYVVRGHFMIVHDESSFSQKNSYWAKTRK